MSCRPAVAVSGGYSAIFRNSASGSSYRLWMPSRFSTPNPPSLPIAIAVAGDTTPSIAEASSGISSAWGPSCHERSTSSGSRVRLLGTMAISSRPYARRPRLPRPISISTRAPRVSLAWAGNLPPPPGRPDGAFGGAEGAPQSPSGTSSTVTSRASASTSARSTTPAPSNWVLAAPEATPRRTASSSPAPS